jgi:hypothetical protein
MIFSCPDGYLTRAEVFEQAFERLTAGCRDVRLDAPITCTVHDDGETFTPEADEADRKFADWDAGIARRWRVARLLGDAVADGRLPPYIRASNGQMERAKKDDPEEWRREFDNFADDFSSLWLDTGDQRVFWKISDFEAWLASELGGEQTVGEPAAVADAAESLPAEPPVAVDDDIGSTRGQREPAIVVMKRFYPPNGVRPRGVSIAALTKRINREPEFKDRNVSEDTVRLADFDVKGALKK